MMHEIRERLAKVASRVPKTLTKRQTGPFIVVGFIVALVCANALSALLRLVLAAFKSSLGGM